MSVIAADCHRMSSFAPLCRLFIICSISTVSTVSTVSPLLRVSDLPGGGLLRRLRSRRLVHRRLVHRRLFRGLLNQSLTRQRRAIFVNAFELVARLIFPALSSELLLHFDFHSLPPRC